MFKNLFKQKRQQGFTIIEVMIVLAIAGLILVVVLVAVPQLQRNQRDSARKNAASRVASEFGVFAENNDGALPFAASGTGSIDDFTTRYLTGKVDAKNPSTGNSYTLAYAATDASNPTEDQLLVHRGASCSGESASGTTSSASTRSYALRVQLEGGSTYFCVDNQ